MKLPRFSLRTVFVAITAGTIVCWAYFIGWPRWQMYREQMEFENAAKQIKAGAIPLQVPETLPRKTPGLTVYLPGRVTGRTDGNMTCITRYIWPNAVYCVYYVVPDNPRLPDIPCTSVEVFRLPPLPRDYQPQTKRGMNALRTAPQPVAPADAPVIAYTYDLIEFLSGDRKDNHGFSYQLIHSDPPALTDNPN